MRLASDFDCGSARRPDGFISKSRCRAEESCPSQAALLHTHSGLSNSERKIMPVRSNRCTMKDVVWRAASIFLPLMLLWPGLLLAQTDMGRVRGTVSDPQGARERRDRDADQHRHLAC